MTEKPHVLIGMYMIHKGAYEWGCMGFMYAVSEIFLFSLQWASYRSVKFRKRVFHSIGVFWRVCEVCREIEMNHHYQSVFSLQVLTLYGLVRICWSATACLNSAENVLRIYIYFTHKFFLNVALYYTSPFHSTPLLFLVMWFLYSAVEAVKSFIVEFNLVNTVRMGEETCLTQCC